MRAAGLEIVDVIMTTEAVLIGNPKAAHKELVERIGERCADLLRYLRTFD